MEEESDSKLWIRPPDPFSFQPEKWDVWKHRYRRYLNISGQSESSERHKIDLMIYSMGDQAEVINNSFTNKPETLDEAIKEFDRYFNPKRIGCSRASFNKRIQADEEPVESFIADLQCLAEKCEYGTMKDELLRDRIIAGIRDNHLSEQLQLEDNLTLEEVVRIVRQSELPSSVDDTSEQHPSTSTHESSYLATQDREEVSSSTYEISQERLCLDDGIMPSSILSEDEEMTITKREDEELEEKTVTFVYDNFEENYFTPDISPNISSTEKEGNIKIEDSTNENLSDLRKDDNDNDNDSAISSDDSIIFLWEEEGTKQKVKTEVKDQNQEASNIVKGTRKAKNKGTKRKKTGNDVGSSDCGFTYKSCKSLNNLNDDCLLNIFNNLPLCDLIRIERVCKRWRKISLKSWENVKNIDIKNEFKTESIQLKHLEGVLCRAGKYVTSLNCSWLNKSKSLPAKKSMDIINKYCKRLNHLNICYTFNEKNYLHLLKDDIVQNLKWLNIGNEDFSDDYLPTLLKKAVNLEQFVIVGYDKTRGNDLRNLSEKCKTLAVTDTLEFTNEGLEIILGSHRNIENLDVSGTNITPEVLFPFSEQLRALALWDMENFFEDVSVLQKLKLPNLKVLDLSFNNLEVTNEILLTLIDNCPEIEDLRLRKATELDEEGFHHLKNLRKLQYLDLSFTKVQKGEILKLSRNSKKRPPKLKKLFCYGTPINDLGIAEIIAAFPELNYLAISSGKLTNKNINIILSTLRSRAQGKTLTISLRSNNLHKIPDAVKKLEVSEGSGYQKNSSVLKIVYGNLECNCSFEKTCFCAELEEVLVYFT